MNLIVIAIAIRELGAIPSFAVFKRFAYFESKANFCPKSSKYSKKYSPTTAATANP